MATSRLRTPLAAVAATAALAGGVADAALAVPDLEAPTGDPEAAVVLERVAARTSHGVRFTRFRRYVGGIPLLGSDVVVTDAPGRRGDLVVESARRAVTISRRRSVSRREAVRTAVARTRTRSLRARASAELAIVRGRPRDRLVWRVLLPARVPLASFEVLVDARTSGIVRTRDLLTRATGAGTVFDPNPVSRLGSRAGLEDANDADTPALAGLYTEVPLQRLDDATTCLEGRWVSARLRAGPICAPARDFRSIRRADDRFEGVMAYFHIDRFQAYLQSLGFSIVDRPQLVVADATADDNSYFDPLTGEIGLGLGGVDDGEDADVIVHEYGHAIQHAQVPGFGASQEGGAMGEGFGDYLSAVSAATLSSIGPDLAACFAEWDALGASTPRLCLRRVDSDPTVAQAMGPPCNFRIHCAGEVWSSALWDIRAALGAADSDRLVLQSHYSLTSSARFEDGARALLAADQALYGGAHAAFLRDLLSSRGLLDTARLDDTPAGAVPLGVPGSASGTVDAAADPRDVFAVSLTAGRGVVVRSTGTGDVDLRLYPPGTVALGAGAVGGATTPGTASETFVHVPASTGTFLLEVSARAGAASYTVTVLGDVDGDGHEDEADNCPAVANPGREDRDGDGLGDACDPFPSDRANDADGDGRGAEADNCPAHANPTQADWNRNGRGDACDRSSRVAVAGVTARGRTLTVRARVFPPEASAARLALLVERRLCRLGRCGFARVTTVRSARRVANGVARFVADVRRPGRYRLRVVLADPRYATARSRAVSRTVG